MWFAVSVGYNRRLPYNESAPPIEWLIVRVTTNGKFTYFKLPKNSREGGVGGLTAGPDGAMWFVTREAIGRITVNGEVTEFPHERVRNGSQYSRGAMTVGPDGNLWFIGGTPGMVPAAAIDRITTSGLVGEVPFSTSDPWPDAIAWGSDVDVWFASSAGRTIGHVSAAGQFTEYPVSSEPRDLVFGPGGIPWFTSAEGVGSISLSGQLSPVVSFPGGAKRIINGPDGRLWFSSDSKSVIGRVGPGGLVSRVKLRSDERSVFDLAVGPNGTVWYTGEDTTPCEGGGGTCMAIDANKPSTFIGRITPAPLKTGISAGSSLTRRQAKLELSCMDGHANGTCRGRIRLAIPNGPTLARHRFQLHVDGAKTIGLSLGPKAVKAMNARGSNRLIAVAETKGGQTARRSLAIRPPRS